MKKQNILVVVDYQNDFVKGVLAIKDAETIAQNIQKEINNPKYNHIVYTFDTHEQTEYNISQEKELFPIHCEYNTIGWDLFEIVPNQNERFKSFLKEYHPTEPFLSFTLDKETFFCKNKFDIFEGNKFYDTWLTASFDPANTVITVVGVATEYCVNFHVQGLINRGYTVEILENCVKAIDDNIGKQTLKGFKIINEVNEKNVVTEFVEMMQEEYIMTQEDIRAYITRAGDFAIDYAENAGIKGFVLGISGGLDSAVAAYIIRDAINRRGSNLKLIGLSIPISNTNVHMEQAKLVADNTCDSFIEYDAFNGVPFDDIMNKLSQTDVLIQNAGITIDENVRPILSGNVKARMRMIIQYDIARKANALVIGTENKSEWQNSFFSIAGDSQCDIVYINKLYKGLEMWQVAEALGIDKEIIYQDPSDGLGVTEKNTDEVQLGYKYIESDSVMACYLGEVKNEKIMKFYQENIINKELYNKVLKRFNDFAFKRNGIVEFKR